MKFSTLPNLLKITKLTDDQLQKLVGGDADNNDAPERPHLQDHTIRN